MSEPPIGVSPLGRRGHFIINHHHFLDHEHGHEQKHARRLERITFGPPSPAHVNVLVTNHTLLITNYD